MWAKGTPSPNPAGRHPPQVRSLVKALRKIDVEAAAAFVESLIYGAPIVRDVEWHRENARRRGCGESPLPPPESGEVVWPTIAEQIQAVRLLAEWTESKPATTTRVAVTASDPIDDLSRLSDEELDEFLRLKERERALLSGSRTSGGTAARTIAVADDESRVLASSAIDVDS